MTKLRKICGYLAVFAFLLMNAAFSNVAQAQNFGVSEIRAGILAHKVTYGFFPFNPDRWIGLEQVEDINVEILFFSPDIEFFRWMGSPRPRLGASFNIKGVESMVNLGLTWQAPIFDTPLFVEGTFGAALTNGALSGVSAPLSNFGCPVGFYTAASVGVNVDENISVMITYEHMSNLSLCSQNDGLSNLGVRFGYKF
ncbi:MAG: acyloxyacyl hydrolase [Devosiaceae bacterium]|nr:acyloxyacyl hydrolase [Devosiaceae bacterium]